MIQVNLTLLIQACNFIFTFYVLKWFLFAPFINRILLHKKEEKQLRDEIVLKRQDVENFLTEKTSQLSQFQKDATTDFPFKPVTKPTPTIPVEEVTTTPLDQKEHDRLQTILEERLSS